MNADPIRVLVVDDEPLARTHLRSLLSADQEVAVVGECSNGRDAVAAVRELDPDLLLLDIQMPELDGFGVVQALGADRPPAIVFVTAYDEHAMRAFQVCALDYLLKPVDRSRFHRTLERAKTQVRAGDIGDVQRKLDDLLAQLATPAASRRLALRVDGRTLFVDAGEVDWLEAVDNYVRVHVGRQTYVVRATLSRMESRLPAAQFLRVHRSSIVNVDRVREVQPWFQGDYVLILNDGTRVTSGRSYRPALQRLLRQAL
jgi:two-component system LytT family response regulator